MKRLASPVVYPSKEQLRNFSIARVADSWSLFHRCITQSKFKIWEGGEQIRRFRQRKGSRCTCFTTWTGWYRVSCRTATRHRMACFRVDEDRWEGVSFFNRQSQVDAECISPLLFSFCAYLPLGWHPLITGWGRSWIFFAGSQRVEFLHAGACARYLVSARSRTWGRFGAAYKTQGPRLGLLGRRGRSNTRGWVPGCWIWDPKL